MMLNSLNDAIADMLNFKFTWTLMSSTTQHIYLQSKRIGAVNRGQGGGLGRCSSKFRNNKENEISKKQYQGMQRLYLTVTSAPTAAHPEMSRQVERL